MLEHMKTPPTNIILKAYEIPSALLVEVQTFMQSKGIREAQEEVEKEYYTIEEVFPHTEEEIPSIILRGARYREDMTQAQLSKKTNIPIRHISEMENNKRTIGKKNAKLLATALNIDPKMLIAM